jgi:hypothetical protein
MRPFSLAYSIRSTLFRQMVLCLMVSKAAGAHKKTGGTTTKIELRNSDIFVSVAVIAHRVVV